MKNSYLAHGKVILMGEHAVVYGYDALALPLKSLQIRTTVERAAEMWMATAKYHGPFWAAPAEYDGLKYVVRTMLTKAASQQPLKFTYRGQIPTKRGLGSSASVALATTRVLNDYFKLGLTEAEVIAITNQAETINHGQASGLDAATVNSDHLIFFNQKRGPVALQAELKASLLIMDTGELGSTKEAVALVHQQLEQSPAAASKLATLGQLATETKTAWLKQDQQGVGHNFNRAQAILTSLDLSTAKIAELQKIALSHGALGFKLSGSGLGGIVIALCKDQVLARRIATACQSLVTNSWIEEI
ncbi:mevalonate kinase [Lactobacillus xylocopicola]|uniref:Mevalonate kinase n=1 Tax=Lactobacillus xylocopicola TaxID=2976676 RepID=A0ABM8BGW8_9LACO|nr:mevalonate kinase [Lactobacillus xylocopicola]BDR60513.1 mevalonate kinase [Lactobacillus xylocopicola]